MSDLFSRFDGHGIGEEDITDDNLTAAYPPQPSTRHVAHASGIALKGDKSMRFRIFMVVSVAVVLFALIALGIVLVTLP